MNKTTDSVSAKHPEWAAISWALEDAVQSDEQKIRQVVTDWAAAQEGQAGRDANLLGPPKG